MCEEKWLGVNQDGDIGKFWNVDIGFVNSQSGSDDETEFSINAYDDNELSELFSVFCKENNIAEDTVTYVSIVEMAGNFENLS